MEIHMKRRKKLAGLRAPGLLATLGPVPPHGVDWSVLLREPWILVAGYLADITLFCCALESGYRYVRYRRHISLFWPLFWGGCSVILLLILLFESRFGVVVAGPVLFGIVIILAALAWLRLTVLAGWQPRYARRSSEGRGKRRE